jgi:hypothetical protein
MIKICFLAFACKLMLLFTRSPNNNIMKQAREHELVSKNGYFWNNLMMKKLFLKIPMPHRNDMENIFPHAH